TTPGRPDIDHHYFVREIREFQRAAIKSLHTGIAKLLRDGYKGRGCIRIIARGRFGRRRVFASIRDRGIPGTVTRHPVPNYQPDNDYRDRNSATSPKRL